MECFCRCPIIWLSYLTWSLGRTCTCRAHFTLVPFWCEGLGCACIVTTAQHWPCDLGEPFVLFLFTLVTSVEHRGKLLFVLSALLKLLLYQKTKREKKKKLIQTGKIKNPKLLKYKSIKIWTQIWRTHVAGRRKNRVTRFWKEIYSQSLQYPGCLRVKFLVV